MFSWYLTWEIPEIGFVKKEKNRTGNNIGWLIFVIADS